MGTFRSKSPVLAVSVDMVTLTIREGTLQVMLVERGVAPFAGHWALPGGFVQSEEDLEQAAYRELAEQTGVAAQRVSSLEQVGAYGSPGRDPRPERVISVAWLVVGANLPDPIAGGDARTVRWVPVEEATTADLAFDHHQILVDGLALASSLLEVTDLATAFVGEEFTVSQLRGVYEAIWQAPLDAANFQRKVTGTPGFLTALPGRFTTGRGRPAQLYQRGPDPRLPHPLRSQPRLP